MRCKEALEEISKLGSQEELGSHPLLLDHLRLCSQCSLEWKRHAMLLGLLEQKGQLPQFSDISPGVMARLGERRTETAPRLRWAAAAAIAIAALLLGYILGLSGSSAQSGDGQAATYKEALSGMPSGSVELAALDSYPGGAVTYAAESRK